MEVPVTTVQEELVEVPVVEQAPAADFSRQKGAIQNTTKRLLKSLFGIWGFLFLFNSTHFFKLVFQFSKFLCFYFIF